MHLSLKNLKRNFSTFIKYTAFCSTKTHFGFETIEESEKSQKVYQVFKNVADSYDTMNDVMSCGIHRLWKDELIRVLDPTPKTRLLDVAGGTGDIAFRYLNYISDMEGDGYVTVADINKFMLKEGNRRALNLRLNNELISWQECDAELLPFESDSFSAYTIAFGIRNVTHIDKVLDEAYRVLEPGGRFLCMEFSQVNPEPLRWLYDQYSFNVIPVMGHLIVGQWEPYQYLVESIRKFPPQDDFKYMIESAGFRCVTYTNLTFGVVSIHSGFKI
ncbi:2-methoxy-6-polyprenyl-1,4-benzoquinol methylase, mitochondrial [Daktulosphaira vitifoliae]|uniref:2-methoxy-6-polyprenyl-1,4-benzoquinol methylase, mitochondrial n=1 Tax=Daktulosphaira vitifoliae TaxID=58002 RepID=UPI0021AAA4E6|nr:2-methoxy-6-polyprenyl-1,4-benzoquinol methylase, mitochondrial [Daktulosphaira vitifoliae]